jgi:hypothetical protein
VLINTIPTLHSLTHLSLDILSVLDIAHQHCSSRGIRSSLSPMLLGSSRSWLYHRCIGHTAFNVSTPCILLYTGSYSFFSYSCTLAGVVQPRLPIRSTAEILAVPVALFPIAGLVPAAVPTHEVATRDGCLKFCCSS